MHHTAHEHVSRAGWEFLRDAGNGVQSICVTRVAPSQLPALQGELEALGAAVAERRALGDDVETVVFDTRALLGGFMLARRRP